MEGSVSVVAIVKIKPEFVEAGRATVEQLVEASRKEEGCLRYDWFKDIKEEGTYVVIE